MTSNSAYKSILVNNLSVTASPVGLDASDSTVSSSKKESTILGSIPKHLLNKRVRSNKVRCCAPNCVSTNLDEDVVWHYFPANEEVRKKWIDVIKNPELRLDRRYRICSKHFTPDAYLYNPTIIRQLVPHKPKLQLKRDAVPSLFGKLDEAHAKKPVKKQITPSEENMIREKINVMRAKAFANRTKSIQTTNESKSMRTQTPRSLLQSLKHISHNNLLNPIKVRHRGIQTESQSLTVPRVKTFTSSNYFDDEWVERDKGMETMENSQSSSQFDRCSTESDVEMDRAFLVRESSLLQLFSHCQLCQAVCTNTTTVRDSVLIVQSFCVNQHTFVWKSQPDIENNFVENSP